MFFFLLSVVSLFRAAVDRLVGENKIVLFMKVRRRLPHHFPLPKKKKTVVDFSLSLDKHCAGEPGTSTNLLIYHYDLTKKKKRMIFT